MRVMTHHTRRHERSLAHIRNTCYILSLTTWAKYRLDEIDMIDVTRMPSQTTWERCGTHAVHEIHRIWTWNVYVFIAAVSFDDSKTLCCHIRLRLSRCITVAQNHPRCLSYHPRCLMIPDICSSAHQFESGTVYHSGTNTFALLSIPTAVLVIFTAR